MSSNSSSEYKVVADQIVSPEPDIIIQISGDMYKGSISSGNKYVTASEAGGEASIADFTFALEEDGEDSESRMTIHNHDMRIETTRDDDQDADIEINSADDIWIEANDEVEIRSTTDEVRIVTNNYQTQWHFKPDGGLRFPDDTIQTTAYTDGADTADFVFDTVEDPDYESTMTVTNNDMVIKTVVDTEASGNIRVESAQNIVLNAGGDAYIGDNSSQNNRIATIGDISSTGTGDITFVDNTISSDTGDDIVIQNKNDDGIVKARITLDQSNEQVLIEAIASDSEWFNDTQWSTAVWAGSVVTITTTPDIINFFDTVPGNITRISINDGGLLTYEGASYGSGNITIDVGGTPPEGQDPLTVTEIRFYYALVSRINIDHDDSEFEIISRGMSMTIDSSGDLELIARDEDIDLRANDDIRFTANWENNGTQREWRMDSEGRFQLPGAGYIENPINSSGDNGSSDTIKIVPDADLLEASIYNVDQYIVIDPTGPNHIHIRAGGTQDASTADLFLGAEKTNVKVSDNNGAVRISTTYENNIIQLSNEGVTTSSEFVTTANPELHHVIGEGWTVKNANGGAAVPLTAAASPEPGEVVFTVAEADFFVPDDSYQFFPPTGDDGDIQWEFAPNGAIYGPAMGGVKVPAINNVQAGEDLYVYSDKARIVVSADKDVSVYSDEGDIILNSDVGGEYLGAASSENQIATIGDLPTGATGTFTSADNKTITVTNGIITAITPL